MGCKNKNTFCQNNLLQHAHMQIYTHICILNSCVYVTLQIRQVGHLPDIQLHWHRGEKTEYCCKHNHRFAQWQDKGKMDQYLFLGLQQLLVGTGSYKTRVRITFHQFVNVLLKGKESVVTPTKEDIGKTRGSCISLASYHYLEQAVL